MVETEEEALVEIVVEEAMVETEEVVTVADEETSEIQKCTRLNVMDVVTQQSFHLSQQEISLYSVALVLETSEKNQVEVIDAIRVVETDEITEEVIENHRLVVIEETEEMTETDDQQVQT